MLRGRFLAGLPRALQDAVLARARVWRVADGQPIVRMGQALNHWLGVAHGHALVYIDRPHQAGVHWMRSLGAGDWFQLCNPVALRISDVEVRAGGATTLLAVATADLRLLCERFPELSHQLAVANAGQLRRAMQQVIACQRSTLRQRMLLWWVEQARAELAAPAALYKPSQHALAQSHGVSRQAWCDGLKALEAEGLVRRSAGEVGVVDLARLEAALEPPARAVEPAYAGPRSFVARKPGGVPAAPGPSAFHTLRTTELDRVRRGRWFGSLAPALQQQILDACEVRRLGAGEPLVRAGDWPEGCWQVVQGAIRLDSPHAGASVRTVALLPPGTWHSHHDLIHGSRHGWDAVTITPSTLLWMPAQRFEALFRERLDYRLALTNLLALQHAHLTRFAALSHWPVALRVGAWLQVMHRYFDLVSGPGREILALFTLEHIAQWLGTTRQAVSRELKRLQAQGVIQRDRQQWVLLKPELLPRLLR